MQYEELIGEVFHYFLAESRHVDYPPAHGSSNQAMSVSEGYVP